MADVLRIVRLPDGGRKRAQVLLDLADIAAGSIAPIRGSWAFAPGAKAATVAEGGRRYGGAREVANIHENGLLSRAFNVKGSSADLALATVERVLQETEDFEGKFVEWRPDGASRSVYSELRGTSPWSPKYDWLRFSQVRSMDLELGFVVAPLAHGDACDFTEDWSGPNPIADYTDRAAVNATQIIAGQLAPNGNLGGARRFIFTGRGHLDRDATRDLALTWGSTLLNQRAAILVHELDANNYVEAVLFDDGTSTRLYLVTIVAGAAVQAPNNIVTRLVAGQQVVLRGRAEGLVCTAELYTVPPGPATSPAATTTATLATAGEKAIVATAGRGGFQWTPQSVDARVVSYASRPWSYTRRSLPEVESLRDVPGTAPPLFEAHLTPSGGAAAPIFCLLGWWRRPDTFSWLWNGDFADNANGWSVAAVTGLNGAATSGPARTAGTPASPAKYGTYYGRIVTPATANAGANFKLYRRFRKGVTYTFDLWVRASAAQTVQLQLANEAATDIASGGTTAVSSGGYTLVTVTWTPTGDWDVAYAVLRQVNATAVNLDIDGGRVYEGTTAPTRNQHDEGKGAQPPVGIIDAASQDGANLSGWALTADANYLGGYGLKVTAAGAGTATATYLVDPALLKGDDFAADTLHVEVWAVVELAAGLVSPRLNVTALPESGVAAERLGDWGGIGKTLTRPASGTAKRPVRIGVLRLPTDSQQRWRLKLAASWQSGSAGVFGVDYLWVAPARARASSPTAKANDASYPDFVPSTAEITRRIRSDLSGETIKEPGYPSADTGLGGTLLEMPPAAAGALVRDVDVLVKLSSLAPDDPTSDTTTEQLAHTATVHLGVVPRYFLTRPS